MLGRTSLLATLVSAAAIATAGAGRAMGRATQSVEAFAAPYGDREAVCRQPTSSNGRAPGAHKAAWRKAIKARRK